MAITHYGLFRILVPSSPGIKSAEFFKSQGGHKLPWGKHWEPIHDATSVGDARRKFAATRGIRLSPIYDGEK
jgi:hypothetical protein